MKHVTALLLVLSLATVALAAPVQQPMPDVGKGKLVKAGRINCGDVLYIRFRLYVTGDLEPTVDNADIVLYNAGSETKPFAATAWEGNEFLALMLDFNLDGKIDEIFLAQQVRGLFPRGPCEVLRYYLEKKSQSNRRA